MANLLRPSSPRRDHEAAGVLCYGHEVEHGPREVGELVSSEQERQAPKPEKDPGDDPRFFGGLLIAAGGILALIFYIVTYSPYAPQNYYKHVQGIDEVSGQLGLVLVISFTTALVIGTTLFVWGERRTGRWKR